MATMSSVRLSSSLVNAARSDWREGSLGKQSLQVNGGAAEAMVSCRNSNISLRRSAVAASLSGNIHVTCAAVTVVVPPTVSDTKAGFLNKYKKPIPTIYNSVLQELIVQHHLTRYNAGYKFDPVFALGFTSIFDQLMDGFPNEQGREDIFRAYVEALGESPETYRESTKEVEAWASGLDATSLIAFADREGPVDKLLQDISARAGGGGNGSFHYNRFFAIGLFRLLELAGGSDPSTLEKLCGALSVNKLSVDRDLDTYRQLLNKLTQAKDLLKDFLEREKKKAAERGVEKVKETS